MHRFAGKKKKFIGSFGGVALADILANGVVVLLVVIIITINQRKIQAEQETEQSVEIDAILARDIAGSLVFNDLPSSPPAVLHNYHCASPRGPWRNAYERHDCMLWLYPIFELHSGYMRERNSGRIFHRGELLRENNALDVYLSLLNPVEKQRARLDIYSVDLYYLGLSILRENGVEPSHWHFVGESVPLPPGGEGDTLSESDGTSANGSASDGEGNEGNGEGLAEEPESPEVREQGGNTDTEDAAAIIPEDIPEGASLRDAELIEELLPPSETVGLARGGLERRERAESLSEFEANNDGGYGDTLAEELARAISEERGTEGDSFGRPSSLKIRAPFGGEGEDGTLLFQQLFEGAFPQVQAGEPVDYHTFMILFLNEYLRRADKSGIDSININQLFTEFLTNGFSRVSTEEVQLAESLRENMRIAFEAEDGPLEVEYRLCSFCLSRLLMPINGPLESIHLFSMNLFQSTQSTSRLAELVNADMRLFPYPDTGKTTEIFRGDTILIPSDILDFERWYPIAVLDPNISNVVIGYVYGGEIIEGFDFGVLGELNKVYLGSQSIFTKLPVFSSRREIVLSLVYGGTFILIVMILWALGSGITRARPTS